MCWRGAMEAVNRQYQEVANPGRMASGGQERRHTPGTTSPRKDGKPECQAFGKKAKDGVDGCSYDTIWNCWLGCSQVVAYWHANCRRGPGVPVLPPTEFRPPLLSSAPVYGKETQAGLRSSTERKEDGTRP